MNAEIISSNYNPENSSQILVVVQFTDPSGNTFNTNYTFGSDTDATTIQNQIQSDIDNFNNVIALSANLIPTIQTNLTSNNISTISLNSALLPASPAMPADPVPVI